MPHPDRQANAAPRILGADVAKDHIVFHDSLTGRGWRTANSADALAQALQACADYDWLVCETTGGYERCSWSAPTRSAWPPAASTPPG
jgi:hypothetical protein